MNLARQSWGLLGSLFVSTCCLGGGPVLAGTAAAFGFGAFHDVLNIYVLGPLMTLSVLWITWNLRIQGRALAGQARHYAPFWFGLTGGVLAWAGVVLPHVVSGTHPLGTALIVIGMIPLGAATVWGLIDQRRPDRVATRTR